MTRYVKGYKGPMLPAAPPRPTAVPTRPVFGSNAADPKPASLTPAVSTRPPAPKPTGPMVPVRGGGMAPASVATMMKNTPQKGTIPQAINTAGKVQQSVGNSFGNAIAQAMKNANLGKKHGGTTTLHSITKSNKKSNW